MHRRVVVVAGIVILVIGVVVVLLATGRPEVDGQKEDLASDVKIGRGPLPPRNVDTADILETDARSEEGIVTLEARMGTSLIRPVPEQSVTWRWEIYEDREMTWIVSANVDLGPHVSAIQTKGDYSASTNDRSLPGRVDTARDTITIHLRTGEIEGFPEVFDVVLKTSLDGMRTEAKSALATDRAPDEGFLQVGR